MFSFFQKNWRFLLGIFVLALVVLVNIFPRGYVFGGGDTLQFIEAKNNFRDLIFDWELRAFFFYAIFCLLDWFGTSESVQLSFYLGLFIFGAYVSFYAFSKLIFKVSERNSVLISLFYALNLYTLFLFTGNSGFSYFPSLYIFIPILIGLYVKFLKTQKNIYGAFFALIIFLGSSGFGNPAFFLSFAIFLFCLFWALVIFKYIELNRMIFLKASSLAAVSLLVSLFWLLLLIPEMQGGVEMLKSANLLEFDWTIRHTASPILKTMSLNHFSEDYFPYNFYYKNFDYLKNLFLVFSFIPIFLVGAGFFLKKKLSEKNSRLFLVFIFLLGIFIVLAARITFPFEVLNYYIYHLPGFVTLRGYDKTAIYIPFLLSVLILIVWGGVRKGLGDKIMLGMILLALIAPLPFYLGKIQQTAGYRVNSKNDYRKASMSFLVKIPEEYYSIQDRLNNDREKYSLATLPTTYNDGSGIVYYSKWNFYGSDITRQLYYEKKFIEANNAYFKNWDFAGSFNQETTSSEWLPKLLGLMNAKYVLYHKDAPEDSVRRSEYKMQILADKGLLKNLESNDYFTLYEINPDLILPYISYQKNAANFRADPVWVERNFEKIKESSREAGFREINPKKFSVNFEKSDFSNDLILAEPYNSGWKAYAVDKNGKETEIKNHFLARGYANGWKLVPGEIKNPENISKIIIEYYPLRLMWKGVWISGITVLFLMGYLLKYHYAQKRNPQ